MTRILIIDGHPDLSPERLIHALAAAYREGAKTAGHEVRLIQVGALGLPEIASADEFTATPPPAAAAAQEAVTWAEHLVILHPLWLGGAPAQLKTFFEQVFRYGFAIPQSGWPRGLLKGRTARLIVTMGMPGLAYRLLFGAFGVRSMERSILGLAGVRPRPRLLIGGVGELSKVRAEALLARLRRMGAAAA